MRINQVQSYNQSKTRPNFQGKLEIFNMKTGEIAKATLTNEADLSLFKYIRDNKIFSIPEISGSLQMECRRFDIQKYFRKIAELIKQERVENLPFGKNKKVITVTRGYHNYSITDNENFKISHSDINIFDLVSTTSNSI